MGVELLGGADSNLWNSPTEGWNYKQKDVQELDKGKAPFSLQKYRDSENWNSAGFKTITFSTITDTYVM